MQVKAVYRRDIFHESNGEFGHSIYADGYSFAVSSEKVGVAIQNFLNNAAPQDLKALHNYLLVAYAQAYHELMLLPEADDDDLPKLGEGITFMEPEGDD